MNLASLRNILLRYSFHPIAMIVLRVLQFDIKIKKFGFSLWSTCVSWRNILLRLNFYFRLSAKLLDAICSTRNFCFRFFQIWTLEKNTGLTRKIALPPTPNPLCTIGNPEEKKVLKNLFLENFTNFFRVPNFLCLPLRKFFRLNPES